MSLSHVEGMNGDAGGVVDGLCVSEESADPVDVVGSEEGNADGMWGCLEDFSADMKVYEQASDDQQVGLHAFVGSCLAVSG